MSRSERLRTVQDQIRAACESAGRDPSEVHLIAVSKTFPADALQEVYDAGQRHFGENYAQELHEKGEQFAASSVDDLTWHFIGRIQSNKAKWIAQHATCVHALEKVSHARAIAKHATRSIGVFVAVNIGREDSKGGLMPDEVLDRCAAIHEVDNIALRGLMCIPPRSSDPEASVPYFEQMAELSAEGRARGLPLTELSMGMSNDFHVAIRYGATWLRVGSAIFGART